MEFRKIVGIGLTIILLIVAGYALADDSAEAKMEAAREALNKAEYELAAQLLHEVYELEQTTEEAGNALYWEAFARYRLKRTKELQYAVELLRLQQAEFAHAATAHDGEVLLARLYAEMAVRGEIEAITEIERISDEEREREETRIQALHALARMNPDKALPILEKIIRDETKGSSELRHNALFVLCRIDDQRSEDLLIDMLHTTTEPEMVSEIVMCLSMKDSDQALAAIVSVFRKTDDAKVSEEALFAIGRHGGDQAFDILADIIQDPNRDSEMRTRALFGLAQTGRDDDVIRIATELIENEPDDELVQAALYSLSTIDSDVPLSLYLGLINNPETDDELRAQALFFASRHGELSLDFLLGVYESAESQDLKQQVCHVISTQENSDEGLDAMISIARQETDPEIRQHVVFWIGQYDNDKAAEFLLEIINQE